MIRVVPQVDRLSKSEEERIKEEEGAQVTEQDDDEEASKGAKEKPVEKVQWRLEGKFQGVEGYIEVAGKAYQAFKNLMIGLDKSYHSGATPNDLLFAYCADLDLDTTAVKNFRIVDERKNRRDAVTMLLHGEQLCTIHIDLGSILAQHRVEEEGIDPAYWSVQTAAHLAGAVIHEVIHANQGQQVWDTLSRRDEVDGVLVAAEAEVHIASIMARLAVLMEMSMDINDEAVIIEARILQEKFLDQVLTDPKMVEDYLSTQKLEIKRGKYIPEVLKELIEHFRTLHEHHLALAPAHIVTFAWFALRELREKLETVQNIGHHEHSKEDGKDSSSQYSLDDALLQAIKKLRDALPSDFQFRETDSQSRKALSASERDSFVEYPYAKLVQKEEIALGQHQPESVINAIRRLKDKLENMLEIRNEDINIIVKSVLRRLFDK